MKIAVPWPLKSESQTRIKESLALWPHEPHICLSEPCSEVSGNVMPRNSKDIGGSGKLYIADMIRSVMQFDQEWCGFCNSDCVPVEDLIDDRYDVLIYHRTNIKDWCYMGRKSSDTKDIKKEIWKMRSSGMSDKAIAVRLNITGVPPIRGTEWTHVLIQDLLAEQGGVFIMGQDMYLFRRSVLPKVFEYLDEKDPIIGTAGFDPRLTHWCIKNLKSARIANKLYHKMHESEWNFEEVECQHNGGNITDKELLGYCDGEFVNLFRSDEAAIPSWFISLIRTHRPDLAQLASSSNI